MELVTDYAAYVIAISGALSAVAVVVKKGWPVVKTLARAVITLDFIASELRPNGGTSLRDKVDEIYTRQHTQAVQLSVIEQRLGIEPKEPQ